jgi:hypothetical protein
MHAFQRMNIFGTQLLNQSLNLLVQTGEHLIAPEGEAGHAAGIAGAGLSDYTARVAIYVLLVGVLVAVVLIGGFLIVNLGLMSKRPEDRVGGRTPSDLGLLKSQVWPEEPYQAKALPAEDLDSERILDENYKGPKPGKSDKPSKKVA